MAVIKDKKLDKFIHSKIDNDFGLSVDTIAGKVGNAGRFNVWLGGNKGKIKEVLNAVKDEGVSPSFFAAYEATEGFNQAWGWLNHTTVQGNPVQDARAVAQWIVRQSKTSVDPAWIDFANYVDFVPPDVKAEGNKDYKNMPDGVIGKVVIAGTAAATWEVYYPNGLKASYNGVQDYGAPITEMYKAIERWGGKITDDGGNDGGDDGDDGGNDGGDDGGNNDDDWIGIDWGDLFPNDPVGAIKKAFEGIMAKIDEMTQWDMHSIANDKQFTNDYFRLTKTYNNTYKLELNVQFMDILKDVISAPNVDDGGNDGGNDGGDDGGDDGGNDGGDDGGSNNPKYNLKYIKFENDNYINFTFDPDGTNPDYPFDRPHTGIDLQFINETLKSPVEGKATYIIDPLPTWKGGKIGFGNHVLIDGDDGYQYVFAHMQKINIKKDQRVKVGTVLGITGNTGDSTGAHLHLEIRKGAKLNDQYVVTGEVINPYTWRDEVRNK